MSDVGRLFPVNGPLGVGNIKDAVVVPEPWSLKLLTHSFAFQCRTPVRGGFQHFTWEKRSRCLMETVVTFWIRNSWLNSFQSALCSSCSPTWALHVNTGIWVCVWEGGGVFSSLWHFASDISVFSPFFSTVNPHSHHDRRKKAMEIITSLLHPHLNKRPFLYIDKKDWEYQNRHGVFMIFSFRIEGRYSLWLTNPACVKI